MKMEQTECFETSAYKIQTPENYPEENMQQTNIRFFSTVVQSVLILSKFLRQLMRKFSKRSIKIYINP